MMDQITKRAAPPAEYPETIDALDPAESALLLAIRWWVAARQDDEDPLFHLCRSLNAAGAEAAAFSLDRFMTLAAHSTRRRVITYCPCSPQLGEDEKQLLHSAGLVQNRKSELASQSLQTILTMEGTVLALGPLEEMGEQFAKSRLLFRQRRMPAAEPGFPATIESWISSLSGATLH
jgi:hypothetical protein